MNLLLYFAIAASFISLFASIPLTPAFARDLTDSPLLVAFAVSAYSIANLIGNLFAGLLVDRAPRATLIGGLVGGGSVLAACGGARSIQELILLLALNGLAISLVTPSAYALLSGRLSDGERTGGMSRSGISIGLAAMIGPPGAGFLSDRLGLPLTYRLIGLLIVTMGLLLAFFLERGEAKGKTRLGNLAEMLGNRHLFPAFLAGFTLMFLNGGLMYTVPTMVKGLGYSRGIIGALFSTFALGAIGVFSIERLHRKPKTALSIGMFLLALACGILPALSALPLLIFAMSLYGFGFGLVFPAATMILLAHAPATHRGGAFGVFYAIFSLGAALGPLVVARIEGNGLPALTLAASLPLLFAVKSGHRGQVTLRSSDER